jgi:hypothetical protein
MIITAWIDNSAQDIEIPDVEYTRPEPRLPSITILGGEQHWHDYYDENGKHIGYYQEVATLDNASFTVRSMIDLQPSPEQLEILHAKDVAFTVINEDGMLKVHATGIRPEQDYTIQCTVKEVAING